MSWTSQIIQVQASLPFMWVFSCCSEFKWTLQMLHFMPSVSWSLVNAAFVDFKSARIFFDLIWNKTVNQGEPRWNSIQNFHTCFACLEPWRCAPRTISLVKSRLQSLHLTWDDCLVVLALSLSALAALFICPWLIFELEYLKKKNNHWPSPSIITKCVILPLLSIVFSDKIRF